MRPARPAQRPGVAVVRCRQTDLSAAKAALSDAGGHPGGSDRELDGAPGGGQLGGGPAARRPALAAHLRPAHLLRDLLLRRLRPAHDQTAHKGGPWS